MTGCEVLLVTEAETVDSGAPTGIETRSRSARVATVVEQAPPEAESATASTTGAAVATPASALPIAAAVAAGTME
jgi:hypothetical protein